MNKFIAIVVAIMAATWITGCSSMHDDKGWEHNDNTETQQSEEPYTFEHKH